MANAFMLTTRYRHKQDGHAGHRHGMHFIFRLCVRGAHELFMKRTAISGFKEGKL